MRHSPEPWSRQAWSLPAAHTYLQKVKPRTQTYGTAPTLFYPILPTLSHRSNPVRYYSIQPHLGHPWMAFSTPCPRTPSPAAAMHARVFGWSSGRATLSNDAFVTSCQHPVTPMLSHALVSNQVAWGRTCNFAVQLPPVCAMRLHMSLRD